MGKQYWPLPRSLPLLLDEAHKWHTNTLIESQVFHLAWFWFALVWGNTWIIIPHPCFFRLCHSAWVCWCTCDVYPDLLCPSRLDVSAALRHSIIWGWVCAVSGMWWRAGQHLQWQVGVCECVRQGTNWNIQIGNHHIIFSYFYQLAPASPCIPLPRFTPSTPVITHTVTLSL